MTSTRTFFYEKIVLGALADGAFPIKPQIKLPFTASHIIIKNDANNTDITFSFLFPNVDGELLAKEQPIAFDCLSVGRVWFFKGAGQPNAQVRIWAWRK